MIAPDGPPAHSDPGWGSPERDAARRLIGLALEEDLGRPPFDATTRATVSPDETGRVSIRVREPGVVAGWPVVALVLAAVEGSNIRDGARQTSIEQALADGHRNAGRATWGSLTGTLPALLAAERTILNFLQRLSGIATLTRRYVDAVAGTDAVILDTRKTTPGWRVLEKYAVRCGGGTNHRMGLYDGVLIKDNHLAAAGVATADLGSWLTDVVRPKCVDADGKPLPLEIEVDTLDQFQAVLPARPDIVLLDNIRPDVLRDAVKIRDDSGLPVLLEASGGVNLETVRPIAETGVERISVGALTHSATALDLGFDWAET